MRAPFDPDAVLQRLAREGVGCDTAPFRIDRRGDWHFAGSRIVRPELIALFATILRRAPDGRYWLVTPVEQVPVEVEDTPFLVVELERTGEAMAQRLAFRTNLDRWVTASEDHPLIWRPLPGGGGAGPSLALGDGLEGRLGRPVFYELALLAEPMPGRPEILGVWSCGRFFPFAEGPLGA
jgi:uncharacterized protein